MLAIPKILTSLIIIILGFLIAKIIQKIIFKFLKIVKFEKLTEKSGLNDFLSSTGFTHDAGWIIARIFFWSVILLFLLPISDVLGYRFFADAVYSLINYLPNIIIALIVLIFGTWFGRILSGMVKGSSLKIGLEYSELLGTFVNIVVVIISFIIALSQLKIDASILSNILLIIVASISLGITIAFSLGAKGILSNVLAGVYISKQYKSGDEIITKNMNCKLVKPGTVVSTVEIDNKEKKIANSLLIESF